MPTPFSHLAVARRLLEEPILAADQRSLLRRELPAFLLGSVAADARIEAGAPRAATHFYEYSQHMTDEMPWEAMMRLNPSLWEPYDDAHAAFVAGYVGHLSMDEIWSRQMVGPHFVNRDWSDREHRWVMLHVILIVMDERDVQAIAKGQGEALSSAHPRAWAPFLPDPDLIRWRDLVAGQLLPGGRSLTLDIFGPRAGRTADQLRQLLDDPGRMHSSLWRYISQDFLAETETAMYAHVVSQVALYLSQATIRVP
ncbi:MAG: zinc dependent phospholipase C family protein [Chloroflexi bacterium]|nr:zinc dependent phospholipase C family protein [Chloroflexota bacterium]